ncbi:MAG: hypothetical protein ONB48_01985 [candidate division KSB1 bacterium]|nr:hypothetical protein [candidate division KSB1 bacterium]MDZ7272551.1 hypothetical protein [candidate division KSB1 bacterium]MDZ7284426.1 hypothetical protein [candidate division KSB1 bacterium]MDZ7297178.1 hypothetical protein [candidate division KSB1 bacterium]MDZ7348045.1 hypothetical protein [candidate division KSB1 bacterium]
MMIARIAHLCWISLLAMLDGSSTPTPQAGRLLLAPGQTLQMPAIRTAADSFEVQFTLAVVDSFRLQRHRCRLHASRGFVLHTAPAYQWALQDTALIVLSELDLTLRVAADSSGLFTLRFDFVNLEQPQRPPATAMLIIGTPLTIASPPASDSLARATADSDSVATNRGQITATEPAVTQGKVLLWVLLALVVVGVLLTVVLSILSNNKNRQFSDYTSSGPHGTREPGAAHAKTIMAATPLAATPGPTRIPAPAVRNPRPLTPTAATTDDLPLPANRLASLYKDAEPQSETPAAETATMSDMLAKLQQMAEATQRALTAQNEILASLAKQNNPGNGNAATPGFAAAGSAVSVAKALQATRTAEAPASRWDIAGEPQTRAASLEEIVEAIDGVVAASSTKPLLAPPNITALKLDRLRRTAGGLQQLARGCREAGAPLEADAAESLQRRTLDLALSYETWINEHTLKLSLNLPAAGKDSSETRREILDSLLDGLYETRKIAVQGPIYFDRRITQLMEEELPKLRTRIEALNQPALNQLWEQLF